jgi:hypothetical protein
MSLRKVAVAIIGIAMLLAPVAVQNGMAMATPSPAAHHGQMADSGPCSDQPAGKADHAAKSCCAAMCTAIADALPPAFAPLEFASSRERLATDNFRHGFLSELATPPPRRA